MRRRNEKFSFRPFCCVLILANKPKEELSSNRLLVRDFVMREIDAGKCVELKKCQVLRV